MNAAWPLVVLEDVCDRITVGWVGPMVDEYVDDGVPFLRSQDIAPFSLATANIKFITHEFHARIRKSALRPGDVAVVRTGYPGTAAVVPPSFGEGNCADLVVISPGAGLNPHFLAALFNSAWGISSVGGRLVGSAQQHFNVGAAKKMEVHLPPLPTQRKIAAILSTHDDLIENNNRRIKILEEMAQRIYREWFVDFRYPGYEDVPLADSELGSIPKEWEWRKLGDLADDVRDGVDPRLVDPDTPYIGLEHLPERSIAIDNWGEAKDAGSSKLAYRVGDILFGKIRPYFHKVAPPPVAGICSTDAIVIRPRSEEVRGLVVSAVSSDAFVQQAVQTSQGTKMPRANWKVLENYLVAVPDAALLQRHRSFMAAVVVEIHCLVLATRNLRATRDLLLPRLISGEIEVADLNIATPDAA